MEKAKVYSENGKLFIKTAELFATKKVQDVIMKASKMRLRHKSAIKE